MVDWKIREKNTSRKKIFAITRREHSRFHHQFIVEGRDTAIFVLKFEFVHYNKRNVPGIFVIRVKISSQTPRNRLIRQNGSSRDLTKIVTKW